MYDLFVLGELMTEDLHGYLLQERLGNAVGPIRQISSGTLYPLLSRLVENGWISLRLEEQQSERPRKIYELTKSGRERFHQLMVSPLEHNADTELIFHFKMIYFQYVSKDVQLVCLKQYLDYIQINVQHVNSISSMITKKQLDENKRLQILRMLDHRRHIGLSELGWLTGEIERIKAT
jgi:DNA-binding PadR family transcriptional regulator